jgi:hypothetical protein
VRIVLLTLLVAGCLALPLLATGASVPTFSTSLVQAESTTGEPSMLADLRTTPAALYVTAPDAGNDVWRSTDGGASWATMARTPGGGGDADLAMDADGVLYATDLLSPTQTLATTLPVEASFDQGASWTRVQQLAPDAGTGVSWDRQWIEADGHGHVVVTARGSGLAAWVSRDAAQTFVGPIAVAADAVKSGKLILSNGVLYAPYATATDVKVASSADGGLTWASAEVAPLTGADSLHFPVLAADSAGGLYLAWAGDTPAPGDLGLYHEKVQVFFTSSGDGGATWRAPVQLSDASKVAIFPAIVAGAPGKVDVAYDSADFFGYPDVATPTTTWDVVVEQSLDADTATPHFARAVAAPAFHTGSICTGGLELCPGPQQLGYGNAPTPFDRRVLDFFGMVLDGNGNAVLSYPADRPVTNCLHACALGDLAQSWVDVRVARQTGGPGLR